MNPSRQHDDHDSLAMLPWYPRDWRASTARLLMSALERGAYRELLDAAWLDGGSLTTDEGELQALSGLTPQEWRRARVKVLARFVVGEDGRLRQSRLSWQYDRASTLREKQRDSAREANEAKRRRAAERAAEQDADRDGHRVGQCDGHRDGPLTPPTPSPAPAPTPAPAPVEEEAVDGRDEPAAPATTTTRHPPDHPQVAQVREILEQLAALGHDRAAELRAASAMPARGRYPPRWALDPAELTGRWREVTLTALRMRLAEAQAAAALAVETPDLPERDPEAEADWTRILGALTLAPHTVAAWLRPLVPVASHYRAGYGWLILAAPSAQHFQHVPDAFGLAIAEAAHTLGFKVEIRHGTAATELQRRNAEPGQQAQQGA